MKINIKPSDCRFIINSDKRKVICILEGTEDVVIDFTDPGLLWLFSAKERMDLRMPNRFDGVATCAAEDEWDEEVGKALAFYRMKEKFVNSFYKRVQYAVTRAAHRIDKIVNLSNAYLEQTDKNQTNRRNWLEKRIGDNF